MAVPRSWSVRSRPGPGRRSGGSIAPHPSPTSGTARAPATPSSETEFDTRFDSDPAFDPSFVTRFDADPAFDPDFEPDRGFDPDLDGEPEFDVELDPAPLIEREARPRPAGRRSLGYKAGLVAVVGISIWMIVGLLSPTTLVDTTDLPDDAGLAAIDAEPNVRPERFAADGAGSIISSGDETIRIEGEPGSAPGGEGAADGVDPESGDEAAGAEGDPSAEAAVDGSAANAEVAAAVGSLDYRTNLDMILGASVRNRNHDNSPHLNTPSAQLVPQNHYGPRSEYLNNPAGNPEQAFPVPAGGQFRVACEFSHFSYDDPLIYPGKPGAAHLHMYFGNTHVNAFSTYDSLINSGSSTCNGQELNRTGYWGAGHVRRSGQRAHPRAHRRLLQGRGAVEG